MRIIASHYEAPGAPRPPGTLVVAVNVRLALAAVAVLAVVAGLSLYGAGGGVGVVASTTTSLYATGLLDALASEYKRATGVEIQFIPVGSGEALERAARGDACMVLAHAPSLEARYLEEGAIAGGAIFAYNYFVIVGPSGDPAGVRGAEDAVDAMRRIYEAGEAGRAVFVSRGDRSGTHVREMQLWRAAGLDPRGKPWYIETGQGMGETLVIASEKQAYTLSDTGTFLKFSLDGRIPGLEALYTGDNYLINIYSAYLSAKCSGREAEAAEGFIEFLASPEGQSIIASYGVEEYGQPLFYPAAGNEDWLKTAWEALAEWG